MIPLVDNGVLLAYPGAMDAGVGDNRWMIGRGKGHAVVHGHH